MNQKIIDLTHTLSPEIPTFDGGCGFNVSSATDYIECTEPNLFRVQKLQLNAGIGTHIDSPAHCIPGSATIDNLKLENLVTDCVVIQIKTNDENYVIMPETIEAFEKQYGQIQPSTFVLFHTGWDAFWNTPEKYINDHKYPSVHPNTAKMLLERDIAGLGIDTLSADAGTSDFPVHRVLLGAGKYLVENVANAAELPATGAKIFALPMKIKDGTEAPLRLVAII